jgi:flagellar biosynthesis protein FlhG
MSKKKRGKSVAPPPPPPPPARVPDAPPPPAQTAAPATTEPAATVGDGVLALDETAARDGAAALPEPDALESAPTQVVSLASLSLEPREPVVPPASPDALPARVEIASEPPPPPREHRTCRILAIGGPKGGVGKSVFASNVAIYLASIGRRVLAVDADRGGANLHTLVGGPAGAAPGTHDTAVPGLRLVVSGVDEGLRARRAPTTLAALYADLRAREADYAVVDLGSLATRGAIDAFLAADVQVLVTLPEPTALESTYRFLARAFLRTLAIELGPSSDRRTLVTFARRLGGSPAPLDLWRALDDDGHPLADRVRDRMETFHPALVLNQTRLRADLEVGDALKTVIRRRFGLTLEYLGHIEHDDTVWSAVRARKLLLIESPGTKAAKNVEKIARRILGIESGKVKPAQRTVPPESHHDLLEVERGATDEEVRRAYKRARDIYSADALVCYSLFTPAALEHVRARLDEAFDVLLDPARRRPYELSVFPPSPEHEEPRAERVSELDPLPPPPDITPDTDFTGALLRAVRHSKGIRLEEISAKTKIGLHYLSAIESDDFPSLPAAVYVRGFVTELAKALRLDATQVARTYVRRYRRYLEERQGAAG